MKKTLIFILIINAIQSKAQNFQSVDTDTLYTIEDFVFRRYERDRELFTKWAEFNKKHNIKTKTTINQKQKQDGNVWVFNFDKNGNRVKQEFYSNDTTYLLYEYDNWGNRINETKLNSKHEIMKRDTRRFNSFGKIIYRSELYKGIEKTDVTNIILPDSAIKIIHQLGTHQNTYIYDKTGLLKEYIYSYKRRPCVNLNKATNKHSSLTELRVDSIFVTDSGDYFKRQKFIYKNEVLSSIEIHEGYNQFITQRSYTYSEDKLLSVDTTSRHDSGGLKELILYKYKNGKLIELLDSSLTKKSETYKTKFLYDNDKLIEKKMYGKFNRKDTLLQTFSIDYDDSGNINHLSYKHRGYLYWEKKFQYNSTNQLTYYSNSYGQVRPRLEVFYDYIDGTLTNKIIIHHTCLDCDDFVADITALPGYPRIKTITYDKYGNELEINRFENDSILLEKTISTFNDSLITSKRIYKNDTLIHQLSYDYDENGLLISERNFSPVDSTENNIRYEYEFW